MPKHVFVTRQMPNKTLCQMATIEFRSLYGVVNNKNAPSSHANIICDTVVEDITNVQESAWISPKWRVAKINKGRNFVAAHDIENLS